MIEITNHSGGTVTIINPPYEQAPRQKRCYELIEKNPADKVEPKFKVGDWITNGVDVYKIKNIDLNEINYIFENGGLSDITLTDNICRLWTIQDAKDGDVLVASDKSLFIYDGSINENGSVGFHIAFTEDMDIILNSDDGCGWEEKDSCHPATKEQRDLLFQKMKKAGYEWDAEKKELKKIEQNPAWSEEDEKILNSLISSLARIGASTRTDSTSINYTFSKEIDWLTSIKDKVQPQSQQEWSEDDEMITLSIEQVMNCASLLNIVPEKIDKIRAWLKSLKDKYTWKPSNEQMERLKGIINSLPHQEVLYSLYQDLLTLKG